MTKHSMFGILKEMNKMELVGLLLFPVVIMVSTMIDVLSEFVNDWRFRDEEDEECGY